MSNTINKKQKRAKKQKIKKVIEIQRNEKNSKILNDLLPKRIFNMYEEHCIKNLMDIGISSIEYPVVISKRIEELSIEVKCVEKFKPLFEAFKLANISRNEYIKSKTYSEDMLYVADLSIYTLFGKMFTEYFFEYEKQNVRSIKDPEERMKEFKKIETRREPVSIKGMVLVISKSYNQDLLDKYNDNKDGDEDGQDNTDSDTERSEISEEKQDTDSK